MNQFGAVVVGHDLDAWQHATGLVVELSNRLVDVVQRRQRFFVLAQQHDALHNVVLIFPLALAVFEHRVAFAVDDRPAQEHAAHARLVTDDHALVMVGVLPALRSAVDDVTHLDRNVISRGDNDIADFLRPASFLIAQIFARSRRVIHGQHMVDRVDALAKESQVAHRLDGVALHQIVAAHVGVTGAGGVLQLLERDTIASHRRRIGLNLIALRGAAVGADVDDALDPAKHAAQGPIVQRFHVVEVIDLAAKTVAWVFQRVAHNLARWRGG